MATPVKGKVPKIESINIMRAEALPEEVRVDQGVYRGWVEVITERVNPAKTKIVPLKESPGLKFRKLLKGSNLARSDFDHV